LTQLFYFLISGKKIRNRSHFFGGVEMMLKKRQGEQTR